MFSAFCCLRKPDNVFVKSKAKQIVIPSLFCWYFLNKARPEGGVTVKYVGEAV
jgi:hypothetical protein